MLYSDIYLISSSCTHQVYVVGFTQVPGITWVMNLTLCIRIMKNTLFDVRTKAKITPYIKINHLTIKHLTIRHYMIEHLTIKHLTIKHLTIKHSPCGDKHACCKTLISILPPVVVFPTRHIQVLVASPSGRGLGV